MNCWHICPASFVPLGLPQHSPSHSLGVDGGGTFVEVVVRFGVTVVDFGTSVDIAVRFTFADTVETGVLCVCSGVLVEV